MSSIFSIYIPRMQNTVTDEYINYVFCRERIGNVVRVDFTSVGQKQGFVEKTDDVIKCAFVYLFLYNTMESGEVVFNWKMIGTTALTAALAYIIKNYLSNDEGKFLKK